MKDEKKIYNFETQLARGEAFETILDAVFSTEFAITKATMTEQRKGIDRFFVDAMSNRYSVEYKADERAHDTKNFFVETTSVEGKSAGWIAKLSADFLILLLPQSATIYVFDSSALRATVKQWLKEKLFSERECQNETYKSKGIAVPLATLAEHASAAYKLTKARVK